MQSQSLLIFTGPRLRSRRSARINLGDPPAKGLHDEAPGSLLQRRPSRQRCRTIEPVSARVNASMAALREVRREAATGDFSTRRSERP